MKNTLIILCTIVALCSCTKGDYVDAIPSTAKALVAIDGATPLLSDVENIDTTKTTYLFELAGGEMGLCAMDTDGDVMIKFLNEDDRTEKLIDHMEECNPENSIRTSQLWKHLEEVKNSSNSSSSSNGAKMRMVAQTNVLPKQMQACLLLGTPRGTDPADVLLEAELQYDNDDDNENKGILTLNGHTCSYNEMVKQQIEGAMKVFQPITFDWERSIQPNTLLGIFMNINGTDFVPVLQQNKALNMMLMGSNAIDKIRDNKGNMTITGTIDNHWSVETNTDVNANVNSKAKLVVCLNMQSLPKELDQVIGFMTSKINRIIYKVE